MSQRTHIHVNISHRVETSGAFWSQCWILLVLCVSEEISSLLSYSYFS